MNFNYKYSKHQPREPNDGDEHNFMSSIATVITPVLIEMCLDSITSAIIRAGLIEFPEHEAFSSEPNTLTHLTLSCMLLVDFGTAFNEEEFFHC
jgi:hypothetical protein